MKSRADHVLNISGMVLLGVSQIGFLLFGLYMNRTIKYTSIKYAIAFVGQNSLE
jgi:hypothetical protein